MIDFTNTIIIATSNLGSHDTIENNKAKEKDRKDKKALKAKLMDVLREYFRPEFINRIDDIIVFDSLNEAEIKYCTLTTRKSFPASYRPRSDDFV